MANHINRSEQVMALSATSTDVSVDRANLGARGLHLIIDITAITAGSLVVTIKGKDPISGQYYTLLASASLTATGTTILKVYPGITAAANLSVSDILPRDWQVVADITTGPVTATIAAQYVV
jgi:hypothetical protein